MNSRWVRHNVYDVVHMLELTGTERRLRTAAKFCHSLFWAPGKEGCVWGWGRGVRHARFLAPIEHHTKLDRNED